MLGEIDLLYVVPVGVIMVMLKSSSLARVDGIGTAAGGPQEYRVARRHVQAIDLRRESVRIASTASRSSSVNGGESASVARSRASSSS